MDTDSSDTETDTSGAPQGVGSQVHGPAVGRSVVEAWADEYIADEPGSPGQRDLQGELRQRISALRSRPGLVLHGTFFGEKHPEADVENLLLYNVDDSGAAFDSASRTGLRFELGRRPPVLSDGVQYGFGYRYELVPSTTKFRHWRERRALASWDWVDLAAFPDEHRLEQIWFALHDADVETAAPPREPDTPFAVRLAVRAPVSTRPTPARILKGLFDGVISAFQAQGDTSDTGDTDELAGRVAAALGADPAEVRSRLTSPDRAALGTTPQLLHHQGDGVRWAPSGELCVAGELLAETSTLGSWAIKGTIVELERA